MKGRGKRGGKGERKRKRGREKRGKFKKERKITDHRDKERKGDLKRKEEPTMCHSIRLTGPGYYGSYQTLSAVPRREERKR